MTAQHTGAMMGGRGRGGGFRRRVAALSHSLFVTALLPSPGGAVLAVRAASCEPLAAALADGALPALAAVEAAVFGALALACLAASLAVWKVSLAPPSLR